MAVSMERRGKINICRMILGDIRTNTYIVYDEEKRGILVDPADSAEIIKIKLTELGINLCAILLTHGHFDHIMAAEEIRRYTNAPIYAYEEEKEILESAAYNLSKPFTGMGYTLKADRFFTDGEKTEIGGFEVSVIHTPGHTKGSCCYLVTRDDEKVLISGDTLFAGSYGRYDFPTGSYSELMKSIKEKLLILEDSMEVYPGHNEVTTIGEERLNFF